MMDYCEYIQRVDQATDVLIQTTPMFARTIKTSERATRLFAEGLATLAVNGWLKRPRGKPPWRKGRWKTRGGRDQDRWRKGYERVKRSREALVAAKNARANILQWCRLEDLLRSRGTWFVRFVPHGCDSPGETIELAGPPERDDITEGGES